jgi:2',3'-cyclic-nucleotide 2'-phosphodiesterase (5'-nucleotidase family)
VGLELDGKSHKPTGAFTVELEPIEAAPDAAAQAAIAGDLEKAAALRWRPIGVKLDGKLWREYRAESPFGNLMADVLREATQADVGLVNGGNLRADLPAGDLTLGPLFEALPFANKLAVLKMTGAQLKHLLATNLAGDHGLLSIGGAKLEARCESGTVVPVVTLANGKILADTDPVRIGTSDFLALGGDDFGDMKDRQVEVRADGPTMRDAFADALRKRGTIKATDLYDTANPRIKLSVPKPMRCK